MLSRLRAVRKKLRQIRQLEELAPSDLTAAQRVKLGERSRFERELTELVALIEAGSGGPKAAVGPKPTAPRRSPLAGARGASSPSADAPAVMSAAASTTLSINLDAVQHPAGSAGAFVRETRRDFRAKLRRFGEPKIEQLARAVSRFFSELRSIVSWHKVDITVQRRISVMGASLRWDVEANVPRAHSDDAPPPTMRRLVDALRDLEHFFGPGGGNDLVLAAYVVTTPVRSPPRNSWVGRRVQAREDACTPELAPSARKSLRTAPPPSPSPNAAASALTPTAQPWTPLGERVASAAGGSPVPALPAALLAALPATPPLSAAQSAAADAQKDGKRKERRLRKKLREAALLRSKFESREIAQLTPGQKLRVQGVGALQAELRALLLARGDIDADLDVVSDLFGAAAGIGGGRSGATAGGAPSAVPLRTTTQRGRRRSGAITLLGDDDDDDAGPDSPPAWNGRRSLRPSDFELLCVLGRGAFGKVLQVRLKRTAGAAPTSGADVDVAPTVVYAMKILSKAQIVSKRAVDGAKAERDVLTKVQHPFIVSLVCAFQSATKLYLVMPFVAGGELFFHIQSRGIFLESEARFYIAEAILAVEHLHSLRIVHRDLKPENLLMAADGHLQLTDFGLAKIGVDALADESAGGGGGGGGRAASSGHTRSICGTDEYMAPEMLQRNGFEMVTGDPPFISQDRRKLHLSIRQGRIRFPKFSTAPCNSVLKGLLTRDVDKRLGCSRTTMFKIGGVRALKDHGFFSGLSWDALLAKQMRPPIVPLLAHGSDTQYFETNFTEEDIVDSPVAAATLASEFKRAEERRKRRADEDRQEARATADFDDMVARGAEEERVKAAGASAAAPPQPVERVRSGIGTALALAPATSLAANAADTASAAAAAARGAEEGGAEVAGADLDAVARSLSASPRAQERMLSALFGGFSFTSPSLLSSVGPALGAAKEEADDEEEVEDEEDEEASEHSIGEQAREIRGR